MFFSCQQKHPGFLVFKMRMVPGRHALEIRVQVSGQWYKEMFCIPIKHSEYSNDRNTRSLVSFIKVEPSAIQGYSQTISLKKCMKNYASTGQISAIGISWHLGFVPLMCWEYVL